MIGTSDKGVYVINTLTKKTYHYFFSYTSPSSLLSNNITGLLVDNNNGLWVSTVNGVSFFHPALQKNKSFFVNNSSLTENNIINCLVKTAPQIILIGTENTGLFKYDLQTNKSERLNFNEPNDLKITGFLKLTKDSSIICLCREEAKNHT